MKPTDLSVLEIPQFNGKVNAYDIFASDTLLQSGGCC